jgi:hypothetical protein
MLNLLNNALVKVSFWDELKDEFREIFEVIEDFFMMIKEITYDVLADAIGGDYALLLVITVGIIGLMIIFLAIMNH